MGRSNNILNPWYQKQILPSGDVALLGFTKNDVFPGDLYDKQFRNWDINSDWFLPKKYDTIICLRCAYFAKNPQEFILKCYESLNDEGTLYVDWGLGDHWRFEKYKVGWIKDEEQEYAYGKNNFLWSTVWDDSFLLNDQCKLFAESIKKFGYDDIKKAVYDEVPRVLSLTDVEKYFKIEEQSLLKLWDDLPQLYIFLSCKK